METGLIESKAQFSFHLNGESEIDATLLSETIKDMAELAKSVARKENPDAYLKMNVTAFKNGSFEIVFSAACEIASNLYNNLPAVAGLALTIVTGVKYCFEIKKLLNGKKEKSVSDTEDGKIRIENVEGNVLVAPKSSQIVMNNITADQLVVNIASNAKKHSPEKGFTFVVEDESTGYESDALDRIVRPLPVEETSICQRQIVDAALTIRKAVFFGTSKWSFDYNGHAIDASIDDENFLSEIQRGYALKAGDYINARLEVYVDLDMQNLPIQGSEKYRVLEVDGPINHSYDESDNVRISE